MTRAAATYWEDEALQGAYEVRSVVNTVSGSGLLNPLPLQGNYAAANAGVAAMTIVYALELKRLGVHVNAVSPSMVRTRLTEDLPGMNEASAIGRIDPRRDPVMMAPLVSYLVSSSCGFTGQVLSVRGTRIAVNRGWSTGDYIQKEGGMWEFAELDRQLSTLSMQDPYDSLAAALGGALGEEDREKIEGAINAQLGG